MVYITPDLFNRDHHAISAFWSPMAHQQHTGGIGKRKRHDGEEGPSRYDVCFDNTQTPDADHISNKPQNQLWIATPSRENTRLHASNTSSHERNNHNMSYTLLLSPPSNVTSERRPIKQIKRTSPKATLAKSNSHLMDIEPDCPSSSMSNVRRCQVCKSAPKRKKELVNYMDCKRCDERTCFVCARQCVGGCGKTICRKCNVEVGEDGDSWCLDCYSKDLNS